MAENFIDEIIKEDLSSGKYETTCTRFPPEPNGYLHIGSAKAIFIDYNAAKKYGGTFNLRYDDTNPSKEDDEYVQSIFADLNWLGTVPDAVYYASDYFDKLYEYAVELIKRGKAYVCDLSAEEMKEYRGTLTEPGKNSPYRDRSVEENLDLFERMKNGEFENGAKTLRAKIDMSSPNMNMRDPAIYRIFHASHHRQGDKWCIYPLYDYAHPLEDAIEGITHSLCSIEFENHRPLYDWVLDSLGIDPRPHQYEFARLNVTHTVMSKRYLRKLVEEGSVDGWDDPRMPTLQGLRRRGFTPESIRDFVTRAGVSKSYSIVDIELLEHCIREELNETAPRRIAVIDPVKVVITNYPEGKKEYFDIPNHPGKEEKGTRKLPFSREIYIDREDFAAVPPPKFKRMTPGKEVRLMGSYIVMCEDCIEDENGNVTEIHCTADLETGCNMPADGRKVKGTIHWLDATECDSVEIDCFGKLFSCSNTADIPEDKTYDDYLDKNSVVRYPGAKVEKSLADATVDDRYQFVRTGYFIKDSRHENVFNRIVTLKDSYKPEK